MLKIKSKVVGLLVFVMLTGIAASDKRKLVKIKVNENITVSIPNEWRPMDGMDFTQRYPSVRAPLAAYTNEERTVDFSVNVSASQWPDGNLDIAQRFFKSSIMNMFDRVEMLNEGVKEVNKKNFIYFEFTARINGTRQQQENQNPVLRYTYIQYLIEPSRTLVFSFNCPQRMQNEWRDTAGEMMEVIKVK